MPDRPAVIDRYFIVAAERDTDAFMALFTDDADVVDAGQRHRGSDAIRAWRDGVAAQSDYTTTITGTTALGDHGHRVDTRLDGNVPAAPPTSPTASPRTRTTSRACRSAASRRRPRASGVVLARHRLQLLHGVGQRDAG